MIIEKIPLVFNVPFGRCGNYFLHGLLDSHKQILILPPFSFYRSWNILGGDQALDIDEMYSRWHDFFTHSPMMQNECDFHFTQNQNEIFFRKFKSSLTERGISRKMVFWSIHEAYAEAKGIDLANIKVTLAHDHLCFSMDKMMADFPKARILIIIRDIRAAVGGAFRWYKNNFDGDVPDHFFNLTFDQWWEGQKICRKYGTQMGEDFHVIKNEDLNADVPSEMRNLAAWLGIEFSQSLTESTFCGKPWYTNTSFSSKNGGPEEKENDVTSDSKDFHVQIHQKSRWERELSLGQIAMIESSYRDMMNKYNYPCKTPDNTIWKLYGFITYLAFRKDQRLRWKKTYPQIREFDEVLTNIKIPPFKRIWKSLPPFLKMTSYGFFAIGRRIKIYFFPGNRGRRYL